MTEKTEKKPKCWQCGKRDMMVEQELLPGDSPHWHWFCKRCRTYTSVEAGTIRGVDVAQGSVPILLIVVLLAQLVVRGQPSANTEYILFALTIAGILITFQYWFLGIERIQERRRKRLAGPGVAGVERISKKVNQEDGTSEE